MSFEQINAVTLSVADMARSFAFYVALGFEPEYGGAEAAFTSFRIGHQFFNLDLAPGYAPGENWGRVIFHVSDVDAVYARALEAGLHPSMAPGDAPWGERYFHILDPDGHELSIAKRM